jgi:hypothetical protein
MKTTGSVGIDLVVGEFIAYNIAIITIVHVVHIVGTA